VPRLLLFKFRFELADTDLQQFELARAPAVLDGVVHVAVQPFVASRKLTRSPPAARGVAQVRHTNLLPLSRSASTCQTVTPCTSYPASAQIPSVSFGTRRVRAVSLRLGTRSFGSWHSHSRLWRSNASTEAKCLPQPAQWHLQHTL
jgi:hypothetical protein